MKLPITYDLGTWVVFQKAMNPRSDSGKRAKEVLIGLMKENKTYDELLVSLFLCVHSTRRAQKEQCKRL